MVLDRTSHSEEDSIVCVQEKVGIYMKGIMSCGRCGRQLTLPNQCLKIELKPMYTRRGITVWNDLDEIPHKSSTFSFFSSVQCLPSHIWCRRRRRKAEKGISIFPLPGSSLCVCERERRRGGQSVDLRYVLLFSVGL